MKYKPAKMQKTTLFILRYYIKNRIDLLPFQVHYISYYQLITIRNVIDVKEYDYSNI